MKDHFKGNIFQKKNSKFFTTGYCQLQLHMLSNQIKKVNFSSVCWAVTNCLQLCLPTKKAQLRNLVSNTQEIKLSTLSMFKGVGFQSPSLHLSPLTECQRRRVKLPPPAGPRGWSNSYRKLLYGGRLRMLSSGERTHQVREGNDQEKNTYYQTHIRQTQIVTFTRHTSKVTDYTVHYKHVVQKKHMLTYSTLHLAHAHTSPHSFFSLWFGVASSEQWNRRLNLPSPPPRPSPTWM